MGKTCLFFIALFASVGSYAAQVRGVIKNEAGETVPFVSIAVKGYMTTWSANSEGAFTMTLNPGKRHFSFRSVGFLPLDTVIDIPQKNLVTLEITLREDAGQLTEVTIVENGRDLAKEIMKNVRDKRKEYLEASSSFSCYGYMKISTMRDNTRFHEPDTNKVVNTGKKKSKGKIRREKRQAKRAAKEHADSVNHKYFREEPETRFKQIRVIEAYGTMHYDGGEKYAEEIRAWNENNPKPISNGTNLTLGEEFGEHEIAPLPYEAETPYVYSTRFYPLEFQFYRNQLDIPSISNKPLLSPIATAGALNYRYEVTAQYKVRGKLIYQLKVEPLHKTDALFRGSIYIEDSTWALQAVDLYINEPALITAKSFHITQQYEALKPGVYLPVNRHMEYVYKFGAMVYTTQQHFEHLKYELDPVFPKRTFTDEVRRYAVDAYNYDSLFWNIHRPVELTPAEKKYFQRTDSLTDVYESKEYINAMDSAYNRLDIWNFLLEGIGHRNTYRGRSFMFDPIIAQLNPVGIGGYRHKLGVHFDQDFKNGMTLETDTKVDYGFKNKDVKGKVGVGLTYIPKKFVRTYITVGDYYDMVNTYASIGSIFSRSNYVRTQTLAIAQRMELINGLFAELTLDYSDQKPITDLALEQWSGDLFGSVNTPIDFERYIKTEIKFELKYRIKQKYMIRKNKKVILGSNYPTLQFIYRKGIPGLFNSEVNFDYIEFGAKDDAHMGRMGTTNWNFQMGSFVNKNNLRLLEHKYFRGSDKWFFSDPVRSFQLLGPTLNTNSEYLRANIIHHFDGVLLSKIPLLNRLKINLAGGAGTLLIPEYNFRHAEVFVGIERVTRIRRQLFRFSVYAVTADDNLGKASWTIKFGINFYNSYTNRWEY